MKVKQLCLYLLASLFLATGPLSAQKSLSPDQLINEIRDNSESVTLTIPGWFIRWGAKLADNDMDEKDRLILHELTGHIKKVRFVAAEISPENISQLFGGLNQYLNEKGYDQLAAAREADEEVSIWGQFDGDVIKRLVIFINSDDSSTAVFNIKSNLDMSTLEKMKFYSRLKKEEASSNL